MNMCAVGWRICQRNLNERQSWGEHCEGEIISWAALKMVCRYVNVTHGVCSVVVHCIIQRVEFLSGSVADANSTPTKLISLTMSGHNREGREPDPR